MSLEKIQDQIVRNEALDPTQSFIVQAPAGSGKTGLLTQRFLVLLSRAEKNPEECLGITFTRKAALEMRDRIISALERAQNEIPPENAYEQKTWNLAKEVLKRDKALGWELLSNPSRIKIQTIDSFCASLVRQMPILAHCGVSPNITEDPKPLYVKATRALLESLESNENYSKSIESLLKHLDNNLVLAEHLLTEMLEKREQWLPYIGMTLSHKQIRKVLESGLKAIYVENLFSVETAAEALGDLFTQLVQLGQGAAQELARQGSTSVICSLHNETRDDQDKKKYWLAIAELIFTKEFSLRKSVTKQQGFPAPSEAVNKEDKIAYKRNKESFLNVLQALETWTEFLTAVKNFVESPPCFYTENQWEVLQALMTILPILVAELSIVFQSEGAVDFSEISLSALRALEDGDQVSDLALSLDYKIHHILVDEFQDTSISQWRLLEKLVAGWQPDDGRTLFLVGDPMQSIYRFRQAEVGLFLKAKRWGIGGIPLKSLVLTTNFRSDPAIIQWVNDYFACRFPKINDMQSGAVSFHSSFSAQSSDPYASIQVENFTIETEDHPIPPLKQEADKVIQFIEQTRNVHPLDDIAILVRSRTHLKEILPLLKAANIPYHGVELESLAQRPIVQDLLTLTRALGHLGDSTAWLGLLRGPYCDLSLRDIWLIATASLDAKQSIWSILKQFQQSMVQSVVDSTTIQSKLENIEQKENLLKFITIMDKALSQKGRSSIRDWVEETWLAFSGEKYLYSEQCVDDVNAFLNLLAEAKRNTIDILDLEKNLAAQFTQSALINSDANPVQIMTIHKAKGLEFDTVIVPGIDRRKLAENDRLLWWAERPKNTVECSELSQESYLLLAPIQAKGTEPDPVYAYLKSEECLRSKYESIRLLYVAATRAKKRLLWLKHT